MKCCRESPQHSAVCFPDWRTHMAFLQVGAAPTWVLGRALLCLARSATSEGASGQDSCWDSTRLWFRVCCSPSPPTGGGPQCGYRTRLGDRSVCPKAADPLPGKRPGEVNTGLRSTVPSTEREEREYGVVMGLSQRDECSLDERACLLQDQELPFLL